MKEKQAHVMSLLSLPDPSLHYSLELKYDFVYISVNTCMYVRTHTHTHTTFDWGAPGDCKLAHTHTHIPPYLLLE